MWEFFVCFFLLQQLQGLTVSKTCNETRLTLPQGAINPFKLIEFVYYSVESLAFT